MELTRRDFFKTTGAAFVTSLAFELSNQSQAFAQAESSDWKLVNTEEYTSVCCYCSGGCGTICSVRDGELINLEGDTEHPINQGSLCPKGTSMFSLRNIINDKTYEIEHNPNRIATPLVRRPKSFDWEPISWDDAIDEICRMVKKTRDENYLEVEDDITVNRCDAIASLGAAQLNCEEAWLVQKLMRSLGVLSIDNQTRVCHSSTVAGLAPTFGRGSMTGHYCDFQNADVILSIGSNNLENHPVSSKWVQKALDRGATWIVVDPRFTRTASASHIYSPIRSGTDLAFYGGFIHYILENDLWHHEYVEEFTNISYLINPDYEFDVETGLFSGWNEQTQTYEKTTWGYQIESTSEWDTSVTGTYAWTQGEDVPEFTPPVLKVPKRDPTLQDPNCVFQILKKHYARYDVDTVISVTGMERERLIEIWDTYASTAQPGKSGTILYALGQTQHHYGSENCRAMSMLQLLLGNVGVAGGGINALRGEPNVQGSTDMAVTAYDFPGYLHWPKAEEHPTLRSWLEIETYADGYYTNKPKFFISSLKEWFGEYATPENDFCYDLLPKLGSRDYTTISSFEQMESEDIRGYFLWGQNPCHSAPNAGSVRRSMAKLEWLVAVDWFETESATFWKAPDMDPATVETTVFMLPAALIYEKEGCIANSGRWLQWRYKALEPADEARADVEILTSLWKKFVELYSTEGGVNSDQILKTNWDYEVDGKGDARRAAQALNGYDVATGKLLTNFTELKADGSTACGNWIYSGYYNNNDEPLNPAAQPTGSRGKSDPSGLGLYPEWTYAWPLNRRVLYNRASADTQGKPWSDEKTLVAWDGEAWTYNDVPDFAFQKKAADGTTTPIPPNNKAFMMAWEQVSRLFASSPADGPLPEHYEPFESPVSNQINGSQSSPSILFADHPSVQKGSSDDYPIIATTYSLVEHWQSGMQTRNIPWLVEAQPSIFAEVSYELAEEKGIENGDTIRVYNNRGSVDVPALVTIRIKPFTINGELIHQIGLPHHWGWASGYSTGPVINDLTPNVGDPNSYIPEYKAFLVNVEKA